MSNAVWEQQRQPFSIGSGQRGVVLLHGFGGIPGELRGLGDAIAAAGFEVHAPLLDGHGDAPAALRNVRWQDWLRSVQDSYDSLRQTCTDVSVVGFSMGGLLALQLAARNPVAHVVSLAGALQLAGGWPLKLLPLARYAMPWFAPLDDAALQTPEVQADLRRKLGDIDFGDVAVRAELARTIRIPTAAIHELVRLGAATQRRLRDVTAPTLIVQGERDQTVLPRSAQRIHDGITSARKRLIWLQQSGHQLPADVDRSTVEREVVRWLRD